MTHTSIAPQPHSPSLTFMHRCSHLALSPAPSHSPLTRLRIAKNQAIVCMHLCSHIACFMYAYIGVRTLHTIWERTHLTYTHKSIKGSMGASSHTIWERTHQATLEDDMDTVLFVCFICLFVCLVFVEERHGTNVYHAATWGELQTELCR